jgi:hypothetical protein
MTFSFRRLAALALIAAATGCSVDRTPTAAPTAAPSARSDGLLGLFSVGTVQRRTPLDTAITVTQVIGITGGTLSIPAAGVTVVVPYGAIPVNTQISMTARAGSAVAYDFAPHGLVFLRPLSFSQKLAGTNAGLLSKLSLGYYTDPSLIGATTALVGQLLGGVVNLLTGTFTSTIPHFSGYLLACGSGLL